MTTATVTTDSLNLRAAPVDGEVIAALGKGTALQVLDDGQAGWSHVSTVGDPVLTGWVSSQFIAVDGASPATTSTLDAAGDLPMADDDAHPVTVANGHAIGPNGTAFARTYQAGFLTSGLTTLSAWLASANLPAGGPSASKIRCVRAVSTNEGNLEAINSWDNAHLSVGLFQWTAGAAGDPGELPGLIALFKQNSPDAFQDCFGRYGLDVQVAQGALTGHFTLNGAVLASDADKNELRQAVWAYRFWRAAHGDALRAAELDLAASRIDRFVGASCAGFTVGQWLTSEYGIALVLDEHVNRPGHVPGTLAAGIGDIGATDPSNWTTADEQKLIAAYLQRRAATSMTDSQKRADSIAAAVTKGVLSSDRGSFQA